jgi:BTB/POZ domain
VGHYRELLLSKDQSCLSLILDLVENETESSAAIQAISVLSRSFQIAFTTPIPSKVPLFENYVPVAVEACNVVTFSLDDQSLVRADKCALSDTSEVFSSMLYGSFKESKEDVVRLKDVSRASLILLLVHCKSYVGEHELSIGKPDVVDVLELLLISDRYLILDLNVKLKDFIKLKYFNAESLAPLIKWCHLKLDLNCGNEVEELYGDACAFLLSGQIQQQQRVLIFKSIIKERTVWERLKACIFATISHKLQKEFPQFSTFLQFHFN